MQSAALAGLSLCSLILSQSTPTFRMWTASGI